MSYMTVAQKRSVSDSQVLYACYCCTHCANPVIVRLKIRTTRTARTGLLGTKPDELNEQVKAEQSLLTGKVLEYLASPKAGEYPGGSVEGIDSPCPVCGSVEPWQTKDLLWKLEASGPIQVFMTLKEAYAWAQGILRARKNAAELAATDHAAMQSAQERLRAIGEELRACDEDKVSGSAAQELASLRAREASLDEQFKAMSAFNKDKKQLKEELDRCREAIAESQIRCNAVVARADAKAAALTVEQAALSLYGKALTNRAALYENKYSIALSLAADGEEKGKSVSLADLPDIGRHTVSEFEKENREALMQAMKPLNDALIAAQAKEESV